MTPAARVQAAIEVLDRIGDGTPAEQALTNWARGARYAGSGDRAAVRDHVFDVLRTRRSSAARGGGAGGRALMRGRMLLQGVDPETIFTGEGHAPAPLGADELVAGADPDAVDLMDLPDWLIPLFEASLGADARPVADALRHRAPVFLRVNTLKADLDKAQAALSDDGIATQPHDLSPTALEVLENPRRIAGSAAFRDGLVELQDAASQAVVDLLPLRRDARVLDYCAGGGGKALAMAARTGGQVFAHDADPGRMRDLPARATRADAQVVPVPSPTGRYDLVLCDAPCSGSGAWRRAPEGKWALTPDRLQDLCATQAEILDTAQGFVAPGGVLAYATCSVLRDENHAQIAAFLDRTPGWQLAGERQFLPSDGGDGFYLACLKATG
ncbi:RsmB/NOP family class I SAM-dependent RNA methyltransferase [Thalassococcus sp. BH17M4-6]|uniref:RsmB/NOP family class I SAM-dependent RNA methyltransferase n=1 Tax=Thalassococcus sp. BH17M4-6 TaxID=3413148 RepID=UPI003BBC62D8